MNSIKNLSRSCSVLRLAALALSVGTVCALAVGCGNQSGASNGQVIRYASGISPDSSLGESDSWYLDEAESRTSTLQFKRSFNGSLLSLQDTLAGIGDGRVQGGYINDGVNPQLLPLWTVAGLPFVTEDVYAQMRSLQELYDSNDEFRGQFEKQGVHVLHFLPIGSSIAGLGKPISKISDLRGQRVRSFGQLAVAVKLGGADPVNLPFSELYESLERGVVDGYIGMSFDVAQSSGLFTLTNNIIDPGTGMYSSGASVINIDTWNKLSQSERDELDKLTGDFYETAAVEIVNKYEDQACIAAKSGKAEISRLPDEEINHWRNTVGKSVTDSWRKSVVDAGVSGESADMFRSEYEKLVAKYSQNSPYSNVTMKCNPS